jgi:hypothetical protein
MADPVRRHDYETPRPPQDPFNPIPSPDHAEPPEPDNLDRPNVVFEDRTGLSAANIVLIAAIVIILGAVAFYIFGPVARMPSPPQPGPAATEPADPPLPAKAPSGNAPAPAE